MSSQPEEYEPLREPGHTPEPLGPVSFQIEATRRDLDETAPLNIHSYTDMLHAAVTLDRRLRHLLAAFDAERGEQQ